MNESCQRMRGRLTGGLSDGLTPEGSAINEGIEIISALTHGRLMRIPFWVTRRDLDSARSEILAAVSRTYADASSRDAAERSDGRRRSSIAIAIGALFLVGSVVASLALFEAATKQLPPTSDPGRIGIAIVDATDRERAFDVDVSYDATGESSRFTISVSDWTSEIRRPVQVAIYVCGALRDGLRLSEANSDGSLRIKQVSGNPTEFDSFLGRHEECSFAIATADIAQAIVFGESTHSFRSEASDRVAIAVPGVATIFADEQLGDYRAMPISRDSRVDVEIVASADLNVATSRPQMPSSGQLSWARPLVSNQPLPTDYFVSGSLQTRESVSQLQLFLAGALAGLAGAALLWLFQLVLEFPRNLPKLLRPQKSPNDAGETGGIRGPLG